MKSCLVVDDSKVVRMVARKILEGLNFEIEEAEDGRKAMDACLKRMPDAILLDLHGAMVAQNSADGEGDLLLRLRAAAPGVPIGVALDLHANVTPAMVGNADVIVGFKTYPHIDMYETGEHAGRLLFDLLAGRSKPAMRWHPLPLMAHTLRSASFGVNVSGRPAPQPNLGDPRPALPAGPHHETSLPAPRRLPRRGARGPGPACLDGRQRRGGGLGRARPSVRRVGSR